VCTCATAALHCTTSGVHVRHYRAALRHPRVCTCATTALHCATPGVHVRPCRAALPHPGVRVRTRRLFIEYTVLFV